MLRSIASGVLEVAGIEGSPAPVSGGGVSAVYYSPWQNLEEIDYNAIVSSRCNHLDIAIYSFTDWKLAQAAVICARSGRLVRIYRDYEQYEQEQKRGLQVAHMLKRPNISVRLKSSTVLMHMKAWSDGCILREGSANWSPSGEKQQDNSLAFINDRASVASFERAFEAMWIRNSNIIIQ
jgi:phosphatidylserine/phosphatidylglycerophosphate/cardiolipin synthase-like enzyme